ncbi:MAG TPA: DUF3551 domain-containing protein [Xanthobacteraceae bacterium]|nr:DUF3551 domain-containing protein [Xanthobacteraceae bacterium]
MRMTGVVLGALFALLLADARPAHAGDWWWSANYPWCAYYYLYGGSNCGFSTFEQCMATVSGVGGICNRNPSYAASVPPKHNPPPRRRPRSYER